MSSDEIFAITRDGLVTVDRSTATVVRTIEDGFGGDGGVFRGRLVRAPDGGTLYFFENVEDYWYSCDSSRGSVYSYDLSSGTTRKLGFGGGLAVSPDGDAVAWIDSELCLADPRAPETDVLTPGDRVRVLDVTTGALSTITTTFPTPADAFEFPQSLGWLAFEADGDLLVASISGDLRRVSAPVPAATMVLDPAPVGRLPEGAVPIGRSGDLVVAFADGSRTTLIAVDPTSGTSTTWWASTTRMLAFVGPDGRVVVADDEVAGPLQSEHVDVLPRSGLFDIGA